jgi:sugar/nucleoside kinase (ribokinase family)
MNSPELRQHCAQKLLEMEHDVRLQTAFLGLDGFVDEIVHVVDKRENAESFQRIPTISDLAARIAAAAGKSTNIELVNHQIKLGGNGPIMANALASLGLRVTYLGALGYPAMHPVFKAFAEKVEAYTVAEAGHTDALEFEDGKLMLGKMVQLNELTWATIQSRFGRDEFLARFSTASLVGFVNWTMIPYMSDFWERLLEEICPALNGPRRKLFFDLADPQKRTHNDIIRALDLIRGFETYFDVILGMNEKEAAGVGEVLGATRRPSNSDELSALAVRIRESLQINTVVVHPVAYALAAGTQGVDKVAGPYVSNPLITTGAGDHFNAGFCLGKLLGLDNAMSLLTGVATSGYYVRSACSPSVAELAGMLRNWPSGEAS